MRRKARPGTATSVTRATHPLFVFDQFGDLERCLLRPGNVHSVDEREQLGSHGLPQQVRVDLLGDPGHPRHLAHDLPDPLSDQHVRRRAGEPRCQLGNSGLADASVASGSFESRLLRLMKAKERSTTYPRARTTKPIWSGSLRTISIVMEVAQARCSPV